MAANPALTLVRTDDGIPKVPMATHHHLAKRPSEGRIEGIRTDDHGILDPHIWLSPPLVKQQAGTILGACRRPIRNTAGIMMKTTGLL